MNEQELKVILNNVLTGLNSNEVERHDWYASLYLESVEPKNEEYNDNHDEPRYSFENTVAIESIKYPELHSLMEQIVETITKIGEQGHFSQIWENEEEQAGGAFARELALYDKKYIPLYFRYIQTNDLDHEVYQLYDMLDIFEKWDGEPSIIPIMIYRGEHGQRSELYEDIANDIDWKDDKKDEYLKEVIAYFKEEWSFDYIESIEDDEEGVEELDRFLSPIFQSVLDLSDDEMKLFVLSFINQMAKDETPTLKSLIKKKNKTSEKISSEDKKAFVKAVKDENLDKVKMLVEKGVPADLVVAKQSIYGKALSVQRWYISVLQDEENSKRRKEKENQMEIVKYLSSKIMSAKMPNSESTYTNDLFMGEHKNYSELIHAMIDSGYPVANDNYIGNYMGLYDVEAAKKIIAIRGKDNGESLTSAARSGNLEVLEYLLSIGVPVNTPYEYSTGTKAYAIHEVILMIPNNKDILIKLLDAGADVNLKGTYGDVLQTIKGASYPKINDEIVELIKEASIR